MLGRYYLPSPEDCPPVAEVALEFETNFNVVPGEHAPILIQNAPDQSKLVLAHWGLIPHWSQDDSFALKMINARAETISEKPSYREAFRKRRCLVIAGGFYTWVGETEHKQPYVIAMQKELPMIMAGIWETWQKDQQEIISFAVITSQSVPKLLPYCQRMPVILPESRHEEWLSEHTNMARVNFMLLPYGHEERLKIYPVTTYVNNPQHRDARCIEPIDRTNQKSQ